MEQPFRTETVDTAAGQYTIELYYDPEPPNPLSDWDHPGHAFFIHGSRYGGSYRSDVYHDNLADADDAGATLRGLLDEYEYLKLQRGGDDAISRRYSKWATLANSPWVLIEGADAASQSDYYRWYVLVDKREFAGSSVTPEESVRVTMSVYRKYCAGEFCGFRVKDPAGDEIDSCWGFDDDDYALEEAQSAIEHDAPSRVAEANRVGSGFVGLT